MRRVLGLIAVVCCTLAGLQVAWAQAGKRVALVIGNGTYQKVGKLPNPRRDAEAMGQLLRSAGFDVVVGNDLGAADMRRALRDLSERAQDADVAVVFYAGHGIEVNGTNYLVPVDAALQRDLDVEDEAVSLERVTQMIDSARRLRLVILDACRDNPFVQSMQRTTATRSIGRGLARVDVVTSDTLIAFAARHGSTAADGSGGNSPYTAALVEHLATPGLDLRLALGRVRDDVLKRTGNKQEPFVYGSLGGAEVALVPGLAPSRPAQPVSHAAPVPSAAASEWQRVDKGSVAELETFERRHRSSPEAEYARARLTELRRQQAAPSGPPAAGPAPDLRSPPLRERDRMAGELSLRRYSRTAVAHFDCDTLWYVRNALFARHGYRFKSPRGQRVFGTGGTVDSPRLSAVEQHNVNEIRAAEKMKGCPA